MRLKKFITFFLILMMFVSNTMGVIIIYNQIKSYHKKSIKLLISRNLFEQVIQELSFSKEALKNGEYNLKFIDDHEFKYDGKMYDIISKHETEDSIFYKCINDSKEEELEKAFVEFVVNNNQRQDLPFPIKQILNFLNIELFSITGKPNFFFVEFNFYKVVHTDKILSSYKDIPTPPPRTLLHLI